MIACSLFEERLPAAYSDVNVARDLAMEVVPGWLWAISCAHSEDKQPENLAALNWPWMAKFMSELNQLKRWRSGSASVDLLGCDGSINDDGNGVWK